MQIVAQGSLYHRTALMVQAQAESFAKCLAANTLFSTVSVEESKTAKGSKRHFVRFQPASETRQAELVQIQATQRQQRAEEQAGQYVFVLDSDRRFFHCLNLVSGEVYETTQHGCSCGDFTYRGAAVGGCKHMQILKSGNAEVLTWEQASAPPPVSPEARMAQARKDREALWD